MKLLANAARRALTACALAVAVGAGPAAAGPVPPKPDRYVTDKAEVLPLAERDALEARLAAFDRETSNQLLVWIAPHVPEGTTPEELGADAIRAWGVGQAGRDNGIVFFVFTEDRKTRIATGYGLEGAVPDAIAKRIQAEITRPHFARGDFATGVRLGVEALMAAARGEGFVGTGRTTPGERSVRWLLVAAAVAVLIVARLRRARVGWLVAIVLFGGFINVTGYYAPYIPAPAFLLFFLTIVGSFAFAMFLWGWIDRRSSGSVSGGWSSSSSGWSSSSSSSSGSDSSSSSDSSGFSGGGGDSGGGGASDSF